MVGDINCFFNNFKYDFGDVNQMTVKGVLDSNERKYRVRWANIDTGYLLKLFDR